MDATALSVFFCAAVWAAALRGRCVGHNPCGSGTLHKCPVLSHHRPRASLLSNALLLLLLLALLLILLSCSLISQFCDFTLHYYTHSRLPCLPGHSRYSHKSIGLTWQLNNNYTIKYLKFLNRLFQSFSLHALNNTYTSPDYCNSLQNKQSHNYQATEDGVLLCMPVYPSAAASRSSCSPLCAFHHLHPSFRLGSSPFQPLTNTTGVHPQSTTTRTRTNAKGPWTSLTKPDCVCRAYVR